MAFNNYSTQPELAGLLPQFIVFDHIDGQIPAVSKCPAHLFQLFLRVVILQYAVILSKKFTQHRLFKHAIFKTEQFLAFKSAQHTIANVATVNKLDDHDWICLWTCFSRTAIPFDLLLRFTTRS